MTLGPDEKTPVEGVCLEPELKTRLPARLVRWADHFLAAAAATGTDPFTLAAICDRESLGGDALSPPGPGGTGDNGNGLGLMQLDKRAHPEVLQHPWQDPHFNITTGAGILREALDALGWDYPAAICAYNSGVGNAKKAKAKLNPSSSLDDKIEAFDAYTTGKNYVKDVLARRAQFLGGSNG